MLSLSGLKIKNKKKSEGNSDLCTNCVGGNSRSNLQVGSERALGQSCRQRPC